MPRRGMSICRYLSFVRDPQTKTLDEYLALFRRCIFMDIFLAIAYVASAVGRSAAEPRGDLDALMGTVSIVLLVATAALFLLDAGLLCKLRSSAKAAAAEMEQAAARLLVLKRICVAASTVALAVYLGRVGVELLAVQATMEGGSRQGSQVATIFIVLILFSKGLRILAVSSFGAWLRFQQKSGATGEQAQTATENGAPAGQEGAALAV